MRKKVRYAAGALGALGVMPALGLVTPAAATQAPAARTGKTVSLAPLATTAAACEARSSGSTSEYDNFAGFIDYSRDNGCIGKVRGAPLSFPRERRARAGGCGLASTPIPVANRP